MEVSLEGRNHVKYQESIARFGDGPGRRRQGDQEFKVNLGCTENLTPDWATRCYLNITPPLKSNFKSQEDRHWKPTVPSKGTPPTDLQPGP